MKKILILLVIFLMMSCSKSQILTNFNKEEWVNDANGCTGMRNEQVNNIMDQKAKLLGLTDRDIMEIFGKPDETNLYQRTQRFLVYYTTAGPDCDSAVNNPSRLEIRISALNTSNEIIYYP